MSIEKIIKNELQLEENLDYHVLYNDNRGAIHKDEYKALFKHCIKENIIHVKKYLIEENINSEIFYDIADKNSEGDYQLKERLKEYHQEKHYDVAPFVYLLKIIEPQYKLNVDNNDQPILEFPNNIIVGHKFEKTNAFMRLYFKDTGIAINSTNDNIDNLADTMELVDSTIYILDVEGIVNRERKLIMYKLTKEPIFNEMKDKAEHIHLDRFEKYKV